MTPRDYGFSRFLQLLFARRFPDWLRYGATVGLAAFFTALRLSVPLSGLHFVLFIPAVFIASLAFGRGPGLLATALTTLTASALLVAPANKLLLPRGEFVSVAVYVALGIGIALLCGTLRSMTHRAMAAERAKTLLLEELAHRTKNDLQTVASLLSLQARAQPETRAALEGAAVRVLTIAKLHNRLRADGHGGVVNIRDYLQDLCHDLSQTYGELRPVVVRVDAEPAVLGTDVAGPLGLIVNELVTNAFKYAFPGTSGGTVAVSFRRSGADGFALTVRDDGVGMTGAKEGMGSRLVRMLVQQMDGTLQRADGAPGTSTSVRLPGPG